MEQAERETCQETPSLQAHIHTQAHTEEYVQVLDIDFVVAD